MKNFDPRYNQLPKTEIHIHLEGSIRTQTIIDNAREYGLKLPSYVASELDGHVKVYEQMRDLHAVLEAFAIFQDSITSPQAVERIARELFEDEAQQNVRLLEVRFSPDWAFRGHRLDWDAALEGLLRAKAEAEARYKMAIGYIAITSRSLGPESCRRTVDWAIRHREHILGIDLADSETDFPIADFIKPVMDAKQAGLKVTVHTGEDTPASYVIDTIHAIFPDRIGHGIHIIEDPRAVELVKERGITLEVNPWSNYLTSAVRTIETHPLKQLFDLGVHVTVNSDDPEVLETNLNNEYRIAHEVLGMSMDDLLTCNQYACQASFLPAEVKQRVLQQYFHYGPGLRARFPATVHLLFFRGDQVLLQRRFQTGFRDGEYSVPAGHLDGCETVVEAAIREGREETGVHIRSEAVAFSSVMHRCEGDERIDFFVEVKGWEGEPFNAEPEKCDDLRWVSLAELPGNMVPYVRRGIQNHREGRRFDEFGWEEG